MTLFVGRALKTGTTAPAKAVVLCGFTHHYTKLQEGLKPSARTEYTQAQPCVARVFFRVKGARAGLRSTPSGGDMPNLPGAPSWVKSAESHCPSVESAGPTRRVKARDLT